ncbi:hypothetical protein HYC85_000167 [Camellia sinensis]|uniref:Uncharacterized protein n=1 Tax=Camellia sinensis TaxID=4442 RepID=A0A7J7I4B2_CAMSI|nr:hypothetical protein HYC85_000167 [Camellia sinensis]
MYAYLCFAGGKISNMVKNEDSGSPSWSASLFMQTIEDVARAVAAAAAAATTVRSPRPYVVFSSKDDNGNSPLHKLQHQVSRVLKGFSQPPEVKSGTYNPEVLTSQKRQWASVQLQSLDHRPLKEPSRLFESMVVVGLHPNCDIQALQKQYFGRKSEGSGKFRSALSGQHQSRVEPNLEPQVLLKYKDLLSFCFPGGVEEPLEGKIITKLPSSISHNGIRLTVNGSVTVQVRGGSAGVIESLYGVLKPIPIVLGLMFVGGLVLAYASEHLGIGSFLRGFEEHMFLMLIFLGFGVFINAAYTNFTTFLKRHILTATAASSAFGGKRH